MPSNVIPLQEPESEHWANGVSRIDISPLGKKPDIELQSLLMRVFFLQSCTHPDYERGGRSTQTRLNY